MGMSTVILLVSVFIIVIMGVSEILRYVRGSLNTISDISYVVFVVAMLTFIIVLTSKYLH